MTTTQKITHKVGNFYYHSLGEYYHLVQVEPDKVCLMGLNASNRYCNPIMVNKMHRISEMEWRCITKAKENEFEFIGHISELSIKIQKVKQAQTSIGDKTMTNPEFVKDVMGNYLPNIEEVFDVFLYEKQKNTKIIVFGTKLECFGGAGITLQILHIDAECVKRVLQQLVKENVEVVVKPHTVS